MEGKGKERKGREGPFLEAEQLGLKIMEAGPMASCADNWPYTLPLPTSHQLLIPVCYGALLRFEPCLSLSFHLGKWESRCLLSCQTQIV